MPFGMLLFHSYIEKQYVKIVTKMVLPYNVGEVNFTKRGLAND